MIEVQRYPAGVANAEDICRQVTYTYGTNAYTYSYSRLTSVQYPNLNSYQCPLAPGYYVSGFGGGHQESYTYNAPGGVVSKQVSSSVFGGSPLLVYYWFDSYGRQRLVNYSSTTFTTTYDNMGRPSSLADSNGTTWGQNVAYDYAGRLTSMQTLSTTESRSYNAASGQLASLGWSTTGNAALTGTLTYTYSTAQNNGQISQVADSLSGETIVYQYDALKRLTSASSTPTNGSSPTAWTENFSFDGFGNLTGKTLNGTLQPIAVNAATNQLSSAYYDANGNMTSGAGATLTYNVDNRLVSAAETSGGIEYYFYAADGKRVWRQLANGTHQFTFYGAHGETLGVYADAGSLTCFCNVPQMNVLFGGRTIWQGVPGTNGVVLADRVGTNRNAARFLPFGDEITSTTNDRLKFATYTRDSYTGLDYADQRYYANTYGRFNSTDPYLGSGAPGSPGSWNRYSYTRNDPINRNDVRGLCDSDEAFEDYGQCPDGSDPGGGDTSIYPDPASPYPYGNCPTSIMNPFGDCSPGGADNGGSNGGFTGSPIARGNPGCVVMAFNGPSCNPVGAPSAPIVPVAGPKCPSYISNFLTTITPLATQIASQWNTSVNDVLALSAYESGWLGPHAQALQNPYGLTNAGGPNLAFSSYQAATNYWSATFGAYVQNITNITSFAQAIQPHYNTANPAWSSTLQAVYSSVLSWRVICGQ